MKKKHRRPKREEGQHAFGPFARLLLQKRYRLDEWKPKPDTKKP
jgi:hypothetical protein